MLLAGTRMWHARSCLAALNESKGNTGAMGSLPRVLMGKRQRSQSPLASHSLFINPVHHPEWHTLGQQTCCFTTSAHPLLLQKSVRTIWRSTNTHTAPSKLQLAGWLQSTLSRKSSEMSLVLLLFTLNSISLSFFPDFPPKVCLLHATNVPGTCRASGMPPTSDNQLEARCFPRSLGSPGELGCTLHQSAWAEGYSLRGI